MSRVVLYSSLFLITFILFYIAIQSIIAIRILELRMGIQKEQLMNYALSSKTLKEKIQLIFSSNEAYDKEILLNVSEAELLQAIQPVQRVDWGIQEKIGYKISQGSSLILFRKSNKMDWNYEVLQRIQEAFYWEKQKKYNQAISIYQTLYNSSGLGKEEDAFVRLHYGFSLFMVSKKQESKIVLNELIDVYPGTHFSDSARLLLNYMEISEKQKRQISKKEEDAYELATILFRMGEYEEAIQKLNEKKPLNDKEYFLYSRCLEEMGELEEAAKGYLVLSENKNQKNIAILANRRLILIGNFYSKNQEIQKISEKNALALGDNQFLESAKQGKSKAEKWEEKNALLNEWKNKHEQDFQQKIQTPTTTHLYVSSEKKPNPNPETILSPSPIPKNVQFRIYLRDGRILYSQSVLLREKDFTIYLGNIPMNMKQENLTRIDLFSETSIHPEFWIQDRSGNQYSATAILQKGSQIYLLDDQNQIQVLPKNEYNFIFPKKQ